MYLMLMLIDMLINQTFKSVTLYLFYLKREEYNSQLIQFIVCLDSTDVRFGRSDVHSFSLLEGRWLSSLKAFTSVLWWTTVDHPGCKCWTHGGSSTPRMHWNVKSDQLYIVCTVNTLYFYSLMYIYYLETHCWRLPISL